MYSSWLVRFVAEVQGAGGGRADFGKVRVGIGLLAADVNIEMAVSKCVLGKFNS